LVVLLLVNQAHQIHEHPFRIIEHQLNAAFLQDPSKPIKIAVHLTST
jgi:hypothetical protein